jgi:hypothetical protein
MRSGERAAVADPDPVLPCSDRPPKAFGLRSELSDEPAALPAFLTSTPFMLNFNRFVCLMIRIAG